jgi:hypothetical protein
VVVFSPVARRSFFSKAPLVGVAAVTAVMTPTRSANVNANVAVGHNKPCWLKLKHNSVAQSPANPTIRIVRSAIPTVLFSCAAI